MWIKATEIEQNEAPKGAHGSAACLSVQETMLGGRLENSNIEIRASGHEPTEL